MPKRYHLNRPELEAAIAAELRNCRDVQSQRRLLAARLALSGQLNASQIASQLGISRRRFFQWMQALKVSGVTGLLKREHGGGQRTLIRGRVRQELQAGIETGRWERAKEIQLWLLEAHAINVKLTAVYYWLRKLATGQKAALRQAPTTSTASGMMQLQGLTAVSRAATGKQDAWAGNFNAEDGTTI